MSSRGIPIAQKRYYCISQIEIRQKRKCTGGYEEKKIHTTVKLLMLTVFIFRRFAIASLFVRSSPHPFETNPFDMPVSFRTVSRNYSHAIRYLYLARNIQCVYYEINTGD